MKQAFILLVFLMSSVGSAATIEFTIAPGTSGGAWNNEQTPVVARMGDVIHFVNADSISHTLHTSGAPCSHGPDMAPGGTWDCTVRLKYSSRVSGPLYDHGFGQSASFWVEIVN
jgi:hypothetical protein